MEEIKKIYRHEKKYIMPWHEFQVLNNKMSYLLKRDVHCLEQGYEVKSIYFDNPYDYALKEKLDGSEVRHKYRIRVYNNVYSCLKLEKKSKHNVMTNKESVLLTEDEARQILSGDYEALSDHENDFLKGFYYKLNHEMYTPKVIVKYTRIAYTYPVSNLRLTFDFKIKKSEDSEKFFSTAEDYTPVYANQYVVMEIKFDHVLPNFIRSALQSPNIMASASSKYVASRFA